ncbi:MAG: tRNA-specific adenosine deaminase [Alphaproteobacteria bacterium CG_4_10_14_0_8_um_filter_37_21]|nr:MAG: tRNA-specific adenosine deaminase [Alphaproteobacteria bacterium CG_4_10_14_0_8_um_filter_37_21]
MDSHKKYMRQAIALSVDKMQAGCGGPFGAIIVKDDVVIGKGWNQVTSSCDPTAHAEVSAIRNACQTINNFSLKGATLYTSCEPCPMCLSAIYWARIDHIFYGNTKDDAAKINFDDDFLYKELIKLPENRTLPMVQILHDESITAFTMWAAKEDKTPY